MVRKSKTKALIILHYSPPIHGASKVGDNIRKSNNFNQSFETRYIKIKSSLSLDRIGHFDWIKPFFLIELLFKVCLNLVVFRPRKIYYTASPRGFAFYRDLVVTLPIKIYCALSSAKLFYHYHARGIEAFTKASKLNLWLTNYMVRNVRLIFISEFLRSEVTGLNSYSKLSFLLNGVEDSISENEFKDIVSSRLNQGEVKVLYLSNMIKAKGYDVVLELAKNYKKSPDKISFDFAGAWASAEDEAYFYNFIESHKLDELVKYHGLVQGDKKKKLFSQATLFAFPSSYKREVFPLAILEALSYGLPILAFSIGAVSKIVTNKVGMITNKELIFEDLKTMIKNYQLEKNYERCREAYKNNYTIEVFEENLIRILNSNDC